MYFKILGIADIWKLLMTLRMMVDVNLKKLNLHLICLEWRLDQHQNLAQKLRQEKRN